jgi:hypothetical protein
MTISIVVPVEALETPTSSPTSSPTNTPGGTSNSGGTSPSDTIQAVCAVVGTVVALATAYVGVARWLNGKQKSWKDTLAWPFCRGQRGGTHHGTSVELK